MFDRTEFIDRFGGVFEHSPWVADEAYDLGVSFPLNVENVHGAMRSVFRASTKEKRLSVLLAHPDLAGKLAVAGELTEESTREQAGAGLDQLSEDEHALFTTLNGDYVRKFGFPFIIAVKGLKKDDILARFQSRIENSAEKEFVTACGQVERIAYLRIIDIINGAQ